MAIPPGSLGNDVSVDATGLIQKALTFDSERSDRKDADTRMKDLELERQNLRARLACINYELGQLQDQTPVTRADFLKKQASIIDECRIHLGVLGIPFSRAGEAIQQFRNDNVVPLIDLLRESRTNHLVEASTQSADRLHGLLLPYESLRIEKTVIAAEQFAESLLEREYSTKKSERLKDFLFRHATTYVTDPSARQSATLLADAPFYPDLYAQGEILQLTKVLRRKSESWMPRTPKTMKSYPQTNVRWMIRRDHEQVLDIHNRSYEDEISMEYMLSLLRRRDTIGMVSEIVHPDSSTQILGSLIYQLHNNYINLLYMSTDPNARRQHVGETMMARLHEKLVDQKRIAIRILTDVQNSDTRDFLLTCGADGIQPFSADVSKGQEPAELFLTRRKLSEFATTATPIERTESNWAHRVKTFLRNVA